MRRHGMELLSALTVLCEGGIVDDSPHKMPVMRSFAGFIVISMPILSAELLVIWNTMTPLWRQYNE